MQLPPLVSECLNWVRAHRVPVVRWGVGCVVALVVGVVTWFVPPLHQQVQKVWAKALPPAADTYDASAPAAQAASLADSVASLKEQIGALEKTVADQKKSIDASIQVVQAQQASVTSAINSAEQDIAKTRRDMASISSTTSASDEPDSSDTKAHTTSSTPVATGPLNINTATADQFDGLPGIGPAYAKRIVDYRDEHGNFKSVDDLDNVSGIGSATIAKIRDLVTV